ncbi:hypothetical protein LWI28_014491 [Acer negundo]|uniref:Uncharacterized protein n=1 Tax=Acer negundo TaxID=4023 RepID=A0AAD5IUT8_ACENE|nr:hypothetical protein LWI28_014491 [Acer negundo]
MALRLSSWLPLTKHNIIPAYSLQKSNNNARINQQVKCDVTTQISDHQSRRSANYQPSLWSYDFLQSLQIGYADDRYKNRAEKLEEEVRCMINNEDAEMLSILELIDDIQRLGLGHRFNKDIKRAFDRIVSLDNGHEFDVKAEEKLHVTALRFRLLRQHGYRISQDVFEAFMDDEGKFKKYVESDVKGILSLYEASFLAFEGENIMDEALTFSRTHLNEVKSMALSELVSHALELPLHRRMVRLEARWYIEAGSERKHVNGLLLELAKLDFNVVQSQLQSDLKDMSRWWTEIDLARKLNFARDRLMECFFWTVGMVPNPQFNQCHQKLTKVAAFITTIDDIYDVYATLDELECFTNAVQRWDLKAVDDLPDYMKLCFMALYNTVNEMAYDSLKQYGENVIPYLTKAAELKRGETASSILCYMRETGVSEEVAREHIRTLIDETWMKMNKDVVVDDDGHPFAEPFVETAINLARIAHCTYQYGDGHGAPDDDKYKNRAEKLEEEVRYMINNEDAEMLSILELIDDIQRLGLGHRFNKDIKRALDRIVSWDNGHEFEVKSEDKLHVTALRFNMVIGSLKAFMDYEGKFKKYVESDVKGMLSLYEASFLAFEGENIMDEALTFSRTHLNEVKSMALSELVSHGLELPLHRRMVRLEARGYIEACSERKHVNGLLLELAKLDFNVVQSQLQSDLKDMSRWWTEIDLTRKLNFARDRLMECFFWTVGMVPNPQFNQCRQELTKVAAFITTIDDIYDVYATLDELECFTNAVQRWDLKAVDDLPDYMKLCFMALYNTVNGMAYDSLKQYGENVIPYLTSVLKQAELERGETASSILCYMRETGVSEEVAREHIRTLIDETWMKMNKDVVVDDDGHPFAEPFGETAINLARIAHCTYQYGDGHGAPDVRAKQNVFSLLIEPISLMKSQQQ